MFKFRIWSTISGQVVYTNSQDGALRALHNSRSLDRVDYKRPGDFHGWRFVNTEHLSVHPIAEIYLVDSRFDTLRAIIYVAVGTAMLCAAVVSVFGM